MFLFIKKIKRKEKMEVDESCPSEMLLHDTKPTQSQIKNVESRIAFPKQSIETTGDIDFVINSGTNEMIDPNSIRLHLEVQLRRGDGTANPKVDGAGATNAASYVIPVNHLGVALFKNVEVRWNNELVYTALNNYAHKCDIETRINTSKSEKDNILSLAGYYPEKVPFESFANDAASLAGVGFDQIDDDALDGLNTADLGFAKRLKVTRNTQTWDLITPIYADIFMQNRWLPPNTILSITLQRNDPRFYLLSRVANANFMIQITKARLHYDVGNAEDDFVKEEAFKTFSGTPRLYPFKRTVLHKYSRPNGMRDFSEPSALMEKVVPRRVFIVIIKEDAYKGSYRLDPFNYAHYNADKVGITINGSGAKLKKYEARFAANLYTDVVNGLLKHTSNIEEIGVNRDNFLQRNTMFSFDPNGLASSIMSESFIKEEIGTIGTDITLSVDAPENCAILIYAEYDAEIIVGADNRPIVKEYA